MRMGLFAEKVLNDAAEIAPMCPRVNHGRNGDPGAAQSTQGRAGPYSTRSATAGCLSDEPRSRRHAKWGALLSATHSRNCLGLRLVY